jgi:hypothetical protein
VDAVVGEPAYEPVGGVDADVGGCDDDAPCTDGADGRHRVVARLEHLEVRGEARVDGAAVSDQGDHVVAELAALLQHGGEGGGLVSRADEDDPAHEAALAAEAGEDPAHHRSLDRHGDGAEPEQPDQPLPGHDVVESVGHEPGEDDAERHGVHDAPQLLA